MDMGGTGRFAALKTALGQKQPDRRMVGLLHGAVFLLLGLTLSSARVLDNGAPFGIAMTAAAGPGMAGVCALHPGRARTRSFVCPRRREQRFHYEKSVARTGGRPVRHAAGPR